MFKGLSTLDAFEQCVKKGLCECHIKEVNQNELATQLDELPRKTFLFIRVNILYTLLFKKSTKCERIKILLLKTPIFSRILAKGDVSDAADAILILDSVVVFTLCQLSKICCIGALFQKNNVTSEDPEIKVLQRLLHIDRFEESVLYHLFPLLQKNFAGFDMDLIKVSYVITLLFVRNYCIKLNIKTAIETIEEDLKGGLQWENFKEMGDIYFQKEYLKDACNAYTSAVMLNSYSSVLFTRRAKTYILLGKYKAAQLDAYIAVIIDPKWCEGYYTYCTSLFHQKLYEEAFNIAKFGLANCESDASYYEVLQTLCIEMETKYLNKEALNNISGNSINCNDPAEKPLPEKKYFPVLVDSDSADSESEAPQKNVPELVESSDSDESETVEKKIVFTQTKNKAKKKRNPPEEPSKVEVTEFDMVKIHSCLKEASEAILSDCGYKAVQIFRGPLRDFIDSPKLNTFEECEVVCIKYAYSTAYCKSGGYDELLKCITILKEIIEKHDSVTFPAAYYALGLTYRKLNRFKEALNYLETVRNFLCKGIHFKVYPWPEIRTVIQETRSDILKGLVDDLIKECENPPNPDAICRFAHCSYQPIYYSDPDFKGYISLFCSEQCCLQYHLQCWKTIKVEKKLTDKEFLEEVCFTPDCDGVIVKVQNIDKKGDLAKEFTSDFKKTGKQKWAKWDKKIDGKEKKKKRANSRSEDGSLDVPIENGRVCSRKNSDANDKFIPVQLPGTVTPPIAKDSTSSDSVLMSPSKVKPSESDFSSQKSDACSSFLNSVQDIKDIMNVSENNEFSNVQEAPNYHPVSENGKEVSSVLEMPDVPYISDKDKECSLAQETTITSDFQNESKFSTKVEDETPQYLVSQCIKNNVYSYMCDFLQYHGPLKTDDPLLTEELLSFPDEVKTMISEIGGIGEFLKNNLRFAFVGDKYVCVVCDLAKAYRMNSSSSMSPDLESFQSLQSTNNSKYFNECDAKSNSQNFGLNPDAVEYTPVVPSVDGKNIDHKTYEDSLDKTKNSSNTLYDTESIQSPFNDTNAISESQKHKSKSCDTVLDIGSLNNKTESISTIADSEKTKIFNANESNEEVSNEHNCKPEPDLNDVDSDSNVDVISHNQSFQESNENLCVDAGDLSPSDLEKDLQTSLKETCGENFNHHKQDREASIKLFIRKYSKPITVRTETDFENSVEITTTEQSKFFENSLKIRNKQLEEENLSLKKQVASAAENIKELSDEVSKLKTSLSSSSFDIEVLKIDYKKKEETLISGREYLIKSIASAHSTIDEQKKRIELLENVNSRSKKIVEHLTTSLKEADEKMKNAIKAEENKHIDIIKSLQKENDELKNGLKETEIQFLRTKKTEFIKRIEDKCHDVSIKKQEFSRGLSMISGNLNPVVNTSMKTIFSQFLSYENELKALELEYVKKIDAQIDKVEKGESLKELKEIEIIKIPDHPHLQSLFPDFDKSVLNSTQMAVNLLNVPSWPQIPSASVIKQANASTSNIPPASTIIPPANPSATVIKPSISNVIPPAKPAVAIIPQATPSATIISQATPSATIISQATPSATIIPQATPCTKVIQPPTPSASIISPITHSVLSSVIPDLETIQKKTNDKKNSEIQEPLRNTGISLNTFSSIPYSVPTLDKEFNKTCAIFRPPDLVPNSKSDIPKVPPGIVNCATNLLSSRAASSSSKDSLETFPVIEKTFGSLGSASKVNEPALSTLEQQKKKTFTGSKIGSSYDKLLLKLKEQFPSYTQEELISLVKEFRSKRQGKLTGLPIDAIISELRTIINSKKEAEKRIHDQKMQAKTRDRVLVNKKLVPDSKAPVVTEQQQGVKKKSAWGSVDSDCKKTFAGNPDDDCTICCDPMTATSAYKVACGHSFHEQCIRQWLRNKSNCPVCRVLLLLPEEYPSL